MEDNRFAGLREKLEELVWPQLYMFKFICPKDQLGELTAIFMPHDYQTKASSKGSYISVTSKIMLNSPEEVVEYYEKAAQIKGIYLL